MSFSLLPVAGTELCDSTCVPNPGAYCMYDFDSMRLVQGNWDACEWSRRECDIDGLCPPAQSCVDYCGDGDTELYCYPIAEPQPTHVLGGAPDECNGYQPTTLGCAGTVCFAPGTLVPASEACP